MIEDAASTPNLAIPEEEMVEPPQPEAVINPEVAPETSRFQRLINATGRLGHLATRGVQTAVVLAELSPANEAIRYSVWGAGYAITQDPLIGALTYGAATLGVEGAAAVAGAPLLETNRSKRITSFLHRKLSKAQKEEDQVEFSRVTKAGTALLGGSVVAMALEKLEDPDKSVSENRRFGLWTSTWLAGACAVQGAVMSAGGNIALDSPEATGAIAGVVGVVAGARWLKRRIQMARRETQSQERAEDYDKENDMLFELVTNKKELKQVQELEEKVWHERGFGSLKPYEGHIEHGRTFATFKDKDCIGLLRIFRGPEELPPFTELPFSDDSYKSEIIDECKKGEIEEVGTLAVTDEYRHGMVAARLERLAYRDAQTRGIKSWGIIMEPERVQKMNDLYGFTFKQLGPVVEYQGGMCAAHIMDLEEVDATMQRNLPELYNWFVEQPLGSRDKQ